jgi:hypothetical protein
MLCNAIPVISETLPVLVLLPGVLAAAGIVIAALVALVVAVVGVISSVVAFVAVTAVVAVGAKV